MFENVTRCAGTLKDRETEVGFGDFLDRCLFRLKELDV